MTPTFLDFKKWNVSKKQYQQNVIDHVNIKDKIRKKEQ